MKSITLHLLLIAALGALAAEAGAQTRIYNGRWYRRIVASDIADARTQAALLGGHLVTIDTQEENDFVFQNFTIGHPQPHYIGLSDEISEGVQIWDSGDAVAFTNWTLFQPDDSGGVEDHVVMSNVDGRWNDVDGSVSRPAIVEGTPRYLITGEDTYVAAFGDSLQGGWASKGVWEMGQPIAPGGPYPASSSAFATNLSGAYPSNSDASVVSPEFVVGQYESNLVFSCDLALHLQTCCDIVRLEMSISGGPFALVGSVANRNWYNSTTTGANPQDGWSSNVSLRRYVRRLSGLTPGDRFQLRMRLISDAAHTGDGAVFDNVKIESIDLLASETNGGDDLTQTVTINGNQDHQHSRFSNSQLVSVVTSSPNGELIGGTLYVLAELYAGTLAPGLAPDIFVSGNPSTTVVVAGGSIGPFGAKLALPFGGHSITFVSPGLPGDVFMIIQGIVFGDASNTANGIYASSDPQRFRL